MSVNFIDFSQQLKAIKAEINAGLSAVFEKSNFILGEEVGKFEAEFAKKHENIQANVYISIGELETPEFSNGKNDMVQQAKDLYSQLESRNYRDLSLKLMVIESATHETAFPTLAIQGLHWLFGKENG